MSRAKGLYSTWTAAMGWTLAARLMVAAETSLRPMAPILPSLLTNQQRDVGALVVKATHFLSSAIAATVLSIGVFLSTR